MKNLTALILLLITGASCYRPHTYQPQQMVGYKAVYSDDPELKKISFTTSKAMSSPGKIYVKGSMILQNDIGTGIHVFDASSPSQLEKRGFIRIPGNVELSVKGNHLYANSYTDLVVIDLASGSDIKEIKRLPNVFTNLTENFRTRSFIPLPEKDVYYECVDPAKGTHVGWLKDTLILDMCHFYNF